jgi:hypothetical protein
MKAGRMREKRPNRVFFKGVLEGAPSTISP